MLTIDTQTQLTLIKLENLKTAAIKNARRHLINWRSGKNSRRHYKHWVSLARGYGFQIHSLLNQKVYVNKTSKESC